MGSRLASEGLQPASRAPGKRVGDAALIEPLSDQGDQTIWRLRVSVVQDMRHGCELVIARHSADERKELLFVVQPHGTDAGWLCDEASSEMMGLFARDVCHRSRRPSMWVWSKAAVGDQLAEHSLRQ